MNYDERRMLMKQRFEELRTVQLARILENINRVCTNDLNYNQQTDSYCPLAIAHSLDMDMPYSDLSNEGVHFALQQLGYLPVNILKGVEGKFYHGTDKERKEDLIILVKEVITERPYEII